MKHYAYCGTLLQLAQRQLRLRGGRTLEHFLGLNVCFNEVSRRDLGWAVQRTRADPADCGATTVAATAWAARRAGVHVFATGGLGGVHRGASDTRDAVWQSTGE